MSKTISLYELIQKTSQEKGRPLKVICDWDDCIQVGLDMFFKFPPDKNDLSKFDDYFQAYFNESTATNKEAVEFTKKIKKEKSAGFYYDKFIDKYGCNWKYEVTPFTTIAEDLLKCLKEDYIDELLVISSFAYWYEGGARPSTSNAQIENKKDFRKFRSVWWM